MSPARILSETARTELLRNNHKNFISVKVDNKELHQIHKPLATRFSRAWKSALQNPTCREVHVTFPPDPPANQLPPLISMDQANKFALKFIMQWIETGGGDSEENTAIPYPRTRPGKQRILAMAEALKIRELVDRVKSDLEKDLVRPKKCPMCNRFEHPGEDCLRCWHCQELGHAKRKCVKYQAELLEREKRHKEWEERRKEWEERQKAWRAREAIRKQKTAEDKERWESNRNAKMIRSGEMAVGDGGKTIVVWR